ncbi:MAG: hypothetical protein CO137_01230 [Candidatus Magasanikbacteria bacterium CG_4_9_14_3_um_filter_32_9]|uniref:Uncharacterized protein n=1 Tax=Candidatus Magasanikbacteria bacterium CG_4_9_14_3_um_filter_32_9 TaxID=1974644 RepID=A0A2M7Z775_9BACT|nr:MAG: hypothetical protein CO137_01230 [Candidatus Magasanikbacteria bacterium CG_4_9_14_3_um_filter_32_9]
MNFISWSDWFKGIFSFFSLIGAIILFQYVGLDTNFLITFILAIISISISIVFFFSSNKVSNETKILISEMKQKLQEIKEGLFVGTTTNIKISDKVEIPKE